jgi:hypothetical protein
MSRGVFQTELQQKLQFRHVQHLTEPNHTQISEIRLYNTCWFQNKKDSKPTNNHAAPRFLELGKSEMAQHQKYASQARSERIHQVVSENDARHMSSNCYLRQSQTLLA